MANINVSLGGGGLNKYSKTYLKKQKLSKKDCGKYIFTAVIKYFIIEHLFYDS